MTRSKFRTLFLLGTALTSLTALPLSAQAEDMMDDLATNGASQSISAASGAKAGENKIGQGAQSYLQTVADRGIGLIANPNMTPERRKASFATLLDDSFDMDTIGRFALGRNWRTATPAQRAEYSRLFRKMIVEVYSARFNNYDGQALKTKSFRMASDTDTVVTSALKTNNGTQDVQIDWRVRYKNGRYKIVDVIVEGVSMTVTQRSDFTSVIQQGGGNIEALLTHLRTPKAQ